MDYLRQAEKYYVSIRPQTNDFHPVHREGCPFMPDDNRRIYLGLFVSGSEAGLHGKKYFPQSSACRFCAHEKAQAGHSMADILPGEEQLMKYDRGQLQYFLN